ncbi:hypothetical protein [Siccirubricoccus phaeus]|uniref:hypothetical protein n=1 Tax=Siccirubricoccus phaeus TaxID=2595053 RepID=UPI0011F38AEF|nr:hypothetical protein [Siccirubricoccus phaeus]
MSPWLPPKAPDRAFIGLRPPGVTAFEESRAVLLAALSLAGLVGLMLRTGPGCCLPPCWPVLPSALGLRGLLRQR